MSGFTDIIKSFNDLFNVVGTTNSNVNTAIGDIESTVSTASADADLMISQQKDVKRILDAENARIQANIQTIDESLFTQKRIVEFNENQRLRTQHYNEILSTFILAACFILVILVAFRQIPFLPDYISTVIIIIIGSAAFIRIFNLYNSLQRRSIIDYNKLDLGKRAEDSPAQIAAKRALAAKSGDLLGSVDIDGCGGPACCDTSNGVKWDDTSKKCVKEAFSVERLKYNQSTVLPNSASEINLYTKF